MGVRATVLRDRLARGKPVRADTVDVVLDAGRWLTGRSPDGWDLADLESLAWHGVVAWCRATGIEVPDDCRSALRAVAEALDPDGSRGLVAAVGALVGRADHLSHGELHRSA